MALANSGADLWYSTWQTNDKKDDYRWANELVEFTAQPDGSFIFDTWDNDLGYRWDGEGRAHAGAYLSGTWSAKEDRPSKGAFILHAADSQGTVRSGFLVGPDTDKRINYGAWILIKATVSDRDAAFTGAKRGLARSMCPGVGDLIALSDGQFLQGFVHQEVAKAALPSLGHGNPLGSVRELWGAFRDYVRRASGLTSDMSALMKAAFDANGPLGQGALLGPGTSPTDEATNKDLMKRFFHGSLFLRNLHEHYTVDLSTDEAVRIILFMNYLFHFVDCRKAKQTAAPGSP